MSLATSYRFESSIQRKSLLKALDRQKDRITRDEMMADRENTVKLEHETNLKAEWNESLEEVAERKRLVSNMNMIKEELKSGAKAAISIRREALRQLFQAEGQQYKTELNTMGKTFYVQRL